LNSFNPYYISYDDKDDITAKKVDKDFYMRYDNKKGLVRIDVDPGYELETVSPTDRKYLAMLRERFEKRGHEPIPLYDFRSFFYEMANQGNIKGEKHRGIKQVHIINILRRLWRAGYLTRYVLAVEKPRRRSDGRMDWREVHYGMFGKKDEIENNEE
jgi:hypothetical protein